MMKHEEERFFNGKGYLLGQQVSFVIGQMVDQRAALKKAVQDGGGFVVVGHAHVVLGRIVRIDGFLRQEQCPHHVFLHLAHRRFDVVAHLFFFFCSVASAYPSLINRYHPMTSSPPLSSTNSSYRSVELLRKNS